MNYKELNRLLEIAASISENLGPDGNFDKIDEDNVQVLDLAEGFIEIITLIKRGMAGSIQITEGN